MKTIVYAIALVLGISAIVPLGSASQEIVPYVGSPGFERLKQLAGQWEGTMMMKQGPQQITASYRVTAGGSALVETVFGGSPHEMVTIYYDDANGLLSLTHYCMLQNQPKMVLKQLDEKRLTFDLAEDADIDVSKERHMHAVTITVNSQNRMTQNWTEYQGGKPKKSEEIAFKRAK